MKLKIKDKVLVTAGKDKGREGSIIKVLPSSSRVVVEGINKYKRHIKPRGKDQPGSILDRERPLPMANVALICPKCKKPTRIGFLVNKEGDKTRICRKCQEELI